MFLAIDFGKKRIGLALGEELPRRAGVIDADAPFSVVIEKIRAICAENEVKGIVMGMPYKGDLTPGELSTQIKSFAENIYQKLGLPVFFEEEQYTSTEAKSMLTDYNIEHSRKTGEVDEMAAILILEQFFNRRKDGPVTPDLGEK